MRICENIQPKFSYYYDLDMPLKDKIEKLAKEIYRANDCSFSNDAYKQIFKLNYLKVPICVAKTQNSISDKKNLLGDPSKGPGYVFNVSNIRYFSGAGFIVVYSGDIIDMPGLPKKPASENIKIDNNGNVGGLS